MGKVCLLFSILVLFKIRGLNRRGEGANVETEPWAQPHILSVQDSTPRLLPCVRAKKEKEKRRREEKGTERS